MIRGQKVPDALATLERTNKKAARIIERLLRSAMANAQNNDNQNPDELIVKSLIVNQGQAYHRGIPMARGRVRRIRKFLSHVHLELGIDGIDEKGTKGSKGSKESKTTKPEQPFVAARENKLNKKEEKSSQKAEKKVKSPQKSLKLEKGSSPQEKKTASASKVSAAKSKSSKSSISSKSS